MAARGSIALGTRRLLAKLSLVTWWAAAIAPRATPTPWEPWETKAQPPITSFDSVKGPSVTVGFPPEKVTRAPIEGG